MREKLGVAYNLFDGYELLPYSVNSIRAHTDYICVVYQTLSNYGNSIDDGLVGTLLELKLQGLIDEFVPYNPNVSKKASVNEVAKRNIGKAMCKKVGCTHFMTMDTDELYISWQFKKAKDLIFWEDCNASACQMITYYKSGNYVLDPPESYFVPFIYRLDNREFAEYTSWPVLADPTRKLKSDKVYIFKREQIQMHHFSYVRKNIRTKLYNSSAYVNYEQRAENIAKYFDRWEYPEKALLGGSKEKFFDVKEVPNIFNLSI